MQSNFSIVTARRRSLAHNFYSGFDCATVTSDCSVTSLIIAHWSMNAVALSLNSYHIQQFRGYLLRKSKLHYLHWLSPVTLKQIILNSFLHSCWCGATSLVSGAPTFVIWHHSLIHSRYLAPLINSVLEIVSSAKVKAFYGIVNKVN